jgi:hypothetical protein
LICRIYANFLFFFPATDESELLWNSGRKNNDRIPKDDMMIDL